MPALESRVWGGSRSGRRQHAGRDHQRRRDGNRRVRRRPPGRLGLRLRHPPAARAALALPGGRSRLPAHRSRRRAEARTARRGALPTGARAMRWTFDPLQLGNAHLNLRSLRRDRRSVPRRPLRPDGRDQRRSAQRSAGRRVGPGGHGDSRAANRVQVDVPPVTADEIAACDAGRVARARVALRDAMRPMFADGWKVTDVDRVGRTYTLSR